MINLSNFYKPKYENTTLIVDGAHALRRSMYQSNYRELSNSRGMPTGAVYGFCKILCSLKRNFAANSLVVTLEGGHSKRRQSIYEDYKKRDGVDEVSQDVGMTDLDYYIHQQSWVRKLVESLGIHVVSVQGKEGDDVIFQLAHLITGNKVIVSEDKDFFTLVSPDITVFRPIKGETVTLEYFQDVTGYISPLHYLYQKVILGDGSDNIPALCKGVGYKTVSDVLNKISPEELNFKKIQETAVTFRGQRYQKLALVSEKDFYRNMALIDISQEKFDITEIMSMIEGLKSTEYDLNAALRIMGVLEFGESTKSDLIDLGNQCRVYPFDTLISKEYVRSIMSGDSVSILGGN